MASGAAAAPDDGVVRYPLFETFVSLQGEGFHTGTAAVFIRLGGCDNGCPWCDTAAAQTTRDCRWLTAGEIVETAAGAGVPTAIITGGEPLLHDLGPLTRALHEAGMQTFLETSGTHALSGDFDWICLSPKRFAPPTEEVLAAADELKAVIAGPDDFGFAEECAARVSADCRLSLQPEWNGRREVLPMIVGYITKHPAWRLSLQTHKLIEIP